MGNVIILSGPIGAGKTSVSKALARLLPAPLACIEGDRFWRFVEKPKPGDRRENFRILMRSMTAAALPFARSGYVALLDFSVPPEFLRLARSILREIPLDFVCLRPSEAVCAARAAGREEGKIADYAGYRDFYALFDELPGHRIEDDTSDAGALACRVREGLAAGLFRVA